MKQLHPDSETARALARLLEMRGEGARSVSLELQDRHLEMLWGDIADMRNRIIHEYFDADYEIVEGIMRNDLPPMLQHLEGILRILESEQS